MPRNRTESKDDEKYKIYHCNQIRKILVSSSLVTLCEIRNYVYRDVNFIMINYMKLFRYVKMYCVYLTADTFCIS